MIDILIVDGHKIVCDGLEIAVSQEFECNITKAKTPYIRDISLFDILIIDPYSIPDVVDFKRLKSLNPSMKIIVLTSYTSKYALYNAIKNGANTFLTKNVPLEVLIEAIEALSNNQPYLTPQAAKVLMNQIQKGEGNYVPELSSREIEILKCIVFGMNYMQMSEELGIAKSTIESHKQNMMKKLGVNKILDLVKKSIILGFISMEEFLRVKR